MKIDKPEAARRTIIMIADFVHRLVSQINLTDDLRGKWKLKDIDLQVLKSWIEGPLLPPPTQGYFQDVGAAVSVADLQNPVTVGDIDSLVTLIWAGIPPANKLP